MVAAEVLLEDIGRAGLMLNNDWVVKQNDLLDARTSHIYSCETLADLEYESFTRDLDEQEFAYAIHRWRNYKRHDAWLALLVELVPGLVLYPEARDKSRDFSVTVDGNQVYFDLKVTRYPRSAVPDLGDGELACWLYANQSQNSRHHLANRFFIVGQPESALYDIPLARETIAGFVANMKAYRHFISHSNGEQSRAVVIRQGVAQS
jgi:hypothetical protein